MNSVQEIQKFSQRLGSEFSWVKTIILYGSWARGDERRDSDVDIAVACDQGVGIKVWQKLLDFIEEFRTLRVVEVVRLDEVTEGSEFWQEIQEDGRVMYERN